jgi:hypothetical protein
VALAGSASVAADAGLAHDLREAPDCAADAHGEGIGRVRWLASDAFRHGSEGKST